MAYFSLFDIFFSNIHHVAVIKFQKSKTLYSPSTFLLFEICFPSFSIIIAPISTINSIRNTLNSALSTQTSQYSILRGDVVLGGVMENQKLFFAILGSDWVGLGSFLILKISFKFLLIFVNRGPYVKHTP